MNRISFHFFTKLKNPGSDSGPDPGRRIEAEEGLIREERRGKADFLAG
jgi:hypothetical protein